jgi:hypothetical protein
VVFKKRLYEIQFRIPRLFATPKAIGSVPVAAVEEPANHGGRRGTQRFSFLRASTAIAQTCYDACAPLDLPDILSIRTRLSQEILMKPKTLIVNIVLLMLMANATTIVAQTAGHPTRQWRR